MTPLDPLSVPLAGLQLIEASAGTGKTFAITTLAVRAVLERIDIGRILIVTFTNAATAELRRRLRERLHLAHRLYENPATPADDDLRALVEQRSAAGHADGDRRRLRAALDGFDEAAIFTIHGFCQRALREFAFESGAPFDAELIGDPRPLLADAVRDVWAARLYDAPPPMVARLGDHKVSPSSLAHVAGLFAQHRDLAVREAPADDDADPALRWARQLMREAGPAVLETLARRKARANVQDFDDLLQQLDGALRGPNAAALAEGIGRRYGLALIDEFQDTDPVQYRIFHALHSRIGLPLFLIGDPKQAIYAFRGADVFAYLAAQRAATEQHTLLTNWRSSPRLVRAVNAVFDGVEEPFVIPEIPFRPATAAARNRDELGGAAANAAPLRILVPTRGELGRPDREPLTKPTGSGHWFYRALADQVVTLLDGRTTLGGRAVRAGDVAVLCRKNVQLAAVSDALRLAGVPSVALGDASVFESPEAQMLEHILRALAEPGDAVALRLALVTPLVGLNSEQVAALNADSARWDDWGERFQHWNERWRGSGVTAALRGLFDELEVAERVLAQPGGERRMTNLLHLGELLQQAASESRRGPRGLVDWLHRMRTDPTLRWDLGSEAAQIRLESDAHAVALITAHKSKGLQYPVVCCPFLWDVVEPRLERDWPCFHDDARRLTIDLGIPAAEDSRARRRQEQLAEETRLLYVALTRAEQLCLLLWAPFNGYEDSPLARLLHRLPRHGAPRERDAAALRGLTDDEIVADLQTLAAAAPDAIAVERLPPPRDLRHAPPIDDAAALIEPPALPPVTQAWRIASFTSLSAGAEALGVAAEEGIDRDEVAGGEASSASGASALRGFPRGRGPGTLVHRILELADFANDDPAALRALVARQLGAARLGAEWIEPLCAALRDVLDTPLVGGVDGFRLRDVPRRRRLTEMEFAFPVHRADGGALTPAALADVFARHGGTEAVRAYGERLRRLPFRPFAGYLRGYIDCVFAHEERWYVVDYKSNDLGAAPACYAPTALAVEMVRHDYVLQYHLYLVAVHRYLQRRLPGYDYVRHVGGALYLFVRGMAPACGPATGIVHDTPPLALIEGLLEVLGGGA
ncbi:UvrD-helicase domain-containing protein [bacterium]|nr:UvrD-helicase domain-containing protein [bacterium]